MKPSFTVFVTIWSISLGAPQPNGTLLEDGEVAPFFNSRCPVIELAEMCESTCSQNLADCIRVCGNDQACQTQCYRSGNECINGCPCYVNCYGGCGNCTNPVCDGVAGNTILVINTYDSKNAGALTYTIGGSVNLDINFEFGQDTGSYLSCSAVHSGKMMIFGGFESPYDTQISQVKGCKLERVGQFPWSVYQPVCNSFAGRVWICFYGSNRSGCKSWDDNLLYDEESANYEHFWTSLVEFEGRPLAVASSKHLKVEQFTSTSHWQQLADFPFANDHFYRFSTVTIDDESYLFDGVIDNATIGPAVKYNGQWSQVGSMLSKRNNHRSLAIGNTVIHIGGHNSKTFEQWNINGENVERKEYGPTIYNYDRFPESFWVEADFCA